MQIAYCTKLRALARLKGLNITPRAQKQCISFNAVRASLLVAVKNSSTLMLRLCMQHNDVSGYFCGSSEHTVNVSCLITSISPVSTRPFHLKQSSPGSFDSTILVQKAEGSEALLNGCGEVSNASCMLMPSASSQSGVLSRRTLGFGGGA